MSASTSSAGSPSCAPRSSIAFFLAAHDALERRIARLVQAPLRGDDRGQRELHFLDAAFDPRCACAFVPGATLPSIASCATTVTHGRARNSATIGAICDASSSTACLPHKNQIVYAVLEFRGERARDLQEVGVAGRRQQNGAIGAHREPVADRGQETLRSHRDEHDFALAALLLQLKSGFERELVVGIDDDRNPGRVQVLPVGGDLDARVSRGNGLETDGDLHGISSGGCVGSFTSRRNKTRPAGRSTARIPPAGTGRVKPSAVPREARADAAQTSIVIGRAELLTAGARRRA